MYSTTKSPRPARLVATLALAAAYWALSVPPVVRAADEDAFVEPGVPKYPVHDSFLAFAGGVFRPNHPPQGANNWRCRSTPHPKPVILMHGTFANQNDNWAALAPFLWNAGYCVYTFNYGGPALFGAMYGLSSVQASTRELAAFIDEVLERTGADEVDVVGHSQGGMLARYYVAYLNGADKIDHLIGLGPANHGSTFLGLRGILGVTAADAICPACAELIADSTFVETVNAPGETLPGVRYTVIATKYDKLVTPFESQFLEGASNHLVQDYCSRDFSGHIGLAYDPIALQLVLNTLDPSLAVEPECRFVGWSL